MYMHWIKTLVRLLASKIFGDGRRCNLFVFLVLLTSIVSKLNFLCVMIFVFRNHCPMVVVNVIFHGCDSMLRIVSDESFLKPIGWAGTMALFSGVANHTPQGLARPHHDFFKMIIHKKNTHTLAVWWCTNQVFLFAFSCWSCTFQTSFSTTTISSQVS
jgi:hypothetical protein